MAPEEAASASPIFVFGALTAPLALDPDGFDSRDPKREDGEGDRDYGHENPEA
jgi:hypothetical protein